MLSDIVFIMTRWYIRTPEIILATMTTLNRTATMNMDASTAIWIIWRISIYWRYCPCFDGSWLPRNSSNLSFYGFYSFNLTPDHLWIYNSCPWWRYFYSANFWWLWFYSNDFRCCWFLKGDCLMNLIRNKAVFVGFDGFFFIGWIDFDRIGFDLSKTNFLMTYLHSLLNVSDFWRKLF